MEKILAIFTLREKEDMGKFMVYGEYTVTEFTGMNSVVYKYPEFMYVNAKLNKDGKITDYKPTGSTWHGVKYQCDDMIAGIMGQLSRQKK